MSQGFESPPLRHPLEFIRKGAAMIYNIEGHEIGLQIDRGLIIIEEQKNTNQSLSFDDKFKS